MTFRLAATAHLPREQKLLAELKREIRLLPVADACRLTADTVAPIVAHRNGGESVTLGHRPPLDQLQKHGS